VDRTSLGDRIKAYESAYNYKFPIRLPLILRLDGVHFHTNVKKWKCKKPFDDHLINAMQMTALYLCENISGAQIAYTQSDEITILVRDDMSNDSQPWHGKELNKIMSVAASKATNAFNYFYFSMGDSSTPAPIGIKELAEFDCRGFIVPEYDIYNVFLWRQRDCEKNSVQMLARSLFSQKQLHGKNGSQMQDMMMLEHQVNWNDLETTKKRGSCIIKKEADREVPARDSRGSVIEGETQIITRPTWIIDNEIPILSQDPDYINRFRR
jgi:tRNA(His) 5'-end guanylyltransferase